MSAYRTFQGLVAIVSSSLIMVFGAVLVKAGGSVSPEPILGLVLDLDADRGILLENGSFVGAWTNQAPDASRHVFVKRDEGRDQTGAGRPTLQTQVKQLKGHNVLYFRQQELVCLDEDAFDSLITGGGCTWLAVLAVEPQRVGLKDVNSFFGNLRNGGSFEGLWGCLDDDNTVWWGARNGVSIGRFDANNPKISGTKLEAGKYYIVAGRLAAGTGLVKAELFVNTTNQIASASFPVNSSANPSRLAIGQERDAVEHPGFESFDGSIARFQIYNRPLTHKELDQLFENLGRSYGLSFGGGK